MNLRVSFRVVAAEIVKLLVVVFVPFRVIVAWLVPVASRVREPPVPLARVKMALAALFDRVIEPTVMAALKLTVWAAVGLLNVALAPTAFGNPEGVQLAGTFQDEAPEVELNVWP